MELLILAGFIWACRHAVKDTTAAVRKYRDRRMAEILKARPEVAGDPKKAARQQMRVETGWWLGEALRGFPVARTGWHAGWIAHKTAVLHQRRIRDEARDTHAETRESLALAYEQRRKQAQDAIDQRTTTWSTPPKGKAWREAVQEAALADVVPLHPQDRAIPDDVWHDHGPGAGDRRIPEPGPFAPDDGLKPAQRQRDRNGLRNICAADGRPGTADDPLVVADGYRVHRSDVDDPDSGFHDPASDLPLMAIVTASDYYDTRPRTEARVTPADPDSLTWGTSADDAREASKDGQLRTVVQKMPDGSLKPLAQFRDGKPVREFNGGSMSTGTTAETTYGQSLATADQMITEAEAEVARLQMSRIPALIEDLSNSGVAGGPMEALDGAHAAISQQIAAAKNQLDSWQSFKAALVADHGAGADYHQSAPGGGAEKAFLRE